MYIPRKIADGSSIYAVGKVRLRYLPLVRTRM
jgi:hypothetical protein